jgi:hypothetical protein
MLPLLRALETAGSSSLERATLRFNGRTSPERFRAVDWPALHAACKAARRACAWCFTYRYTPT